MDFDINTLRGLATVTCMIAFIGVIFWAWSDRKKSDFEEAADLPFSDEPGLTKNPATITNNNQEKQHV